MPTRRTKRTRRSVLSSEAQTIGTFATVMTTTTTTTTVNAAILISWCLLLLTQVSISTASSSQQSLLPKTSSPTPSTAPIDHRTESPAKPLQSWPTRQQELADEANDAMLLHAVQQSMRDWNRQHAQKLQHKQMQRRQRRRRRRRRAAPSSTATFASSPSSSSALSPSSGADKSVCYGDLGCFEDSGPFGYLDMLPSPPEEINTRFMFYSTKNRSDNPLFEIPFLNISDAWRDLQTQSTANAADNRTTTEPHPTSAKSSKRWHALKTFPTLEQSSVRIIVHGFGSACPHVWIYELRTALMAVEDCVVICVDWELGANFPNYVRAAANTRLVGKQLAMFLRGLQQYKQLDLNRVHLIGFSLGAHVSGFAGAELPGLNRITGLDPAGPLFESQHPKARLDSTDATFVDVIHSNGENLILGGLGSWQPMGHVDFYPNGGRVQHGCSNLFVGAVTDFIWSPAAAVEGRSLCNHRRAYKFFIDSVAPRCLFPAFPCANYDDFLLGQCFPCNATQQNDPSAAAKCGNMGYYADRSTGRGQLYLVTREEEPFCAHQFTIEIHSPANDLPLRTLGKLEAVLTGEGQLNETFSITEKDDSEFFAGERVSRILVPHPALGFPRAVTLRYKSYSGWLTKGLPQWTVHKVVLADSFGARRSLCRPEIALYSDKPVQLQLEPGDCVPPEWEGEDYGSEYGGGLDESSASASSSGETGTTVTSTVTTIGASGAGAMTTLSPSMDGYEMGVEQTTTGTLMLVDTTVGIVGDANAGLRDKKEIIELGKSYPIKSNASSSSWHGLAAADTENLIDGLEQQKKHEFNIKQYVQTGYGGKPKKETDAGRSISTSVTEDVGGSESRLKIGLKALNAAKRTSIEEPILKSTTLRANSSPAPALRSTSASPSLSASADAMRPRENSVFTIQLFPFRLGELIERAERYARETLLPLISEQAPRIFRFGGFGGGGGGGGSIETTPTAADDLSAAQTLGQRNARHLKYIPAASATSAAAATAHVANRPMTGEQLTAAGADASGDQTRAVPLMMQRQRRIDLPPRLDSSVRIEASDYEQPAATVDARTGRQRQTPNLLRPLSTSTKDVQLARDNRVIGRADDDSTGGVDDGARSIYYTNSADGDGDDNDDHDGDERADRKHSKHEQIVRIVLPTYRPETASEKVMIVTPIPIPLSAAENVDH